MAKLFDGKKLFASAIKPTGGQPLDDRTVVGLFSDLTNASTFVVNGSSAAYKGMLVAVVETEQVYMLIDENNITSEKSWVAVGSGNGSLAVETYGEAIALATNDNIGQVIYVKTKSSYDADGEGEGEAVEYEAAPYIVIGQGQLQKLAASTSNVSLEGDVAELKTKVSTLEGEMDAVEGRMGDAEEAIKALQDINHDAYIDADANLKLELQGEIAKKVATETYDAKVLELEGAISDVDAAAQGYAAAAQAAAEGVAETKANAAKEAAIAAATELNGAMNTRVLALEGINHDAYIDADANLKLELQGEINKKVDAVDGSRLMTNDEGTKLAGIAEGAQVNKIEIVKVNGTALTIAEADKSVDVIVPTAPVQGVADGDKILALDGDKLKTTLTLAYVPATEDAHAVLRLQGINGEVVSSIDATAFVKDGMLADAKLDAPKGDETGEKYLSLTFNTDGGAEEIRLDVSDLIDYYAAGDGLELVDGKTFKVVVDTTANSYLQVTTNGIAVSQAFLDKITELDNAVLAAAATDAQNKADAAKAAAISEAAADAKSKADAAQAAAEGVAETKANAAKEAAIAAAAADAESKANAAKAAAISEANAHANGLNTAMDARVLALEAIDHEHENKEVLDGITADKVAEWDAAEENAKNYANDTFVTKDGFNAFEQKYEDKLNNIEDNAEANVIENIKINGVDGVIAEKVAVVDIKSNKMQLGTAITSDGNAANGLEGDESNVVYGEDAYIPTVLQGIYSAIRSAVAGGVNSVTANDTSIEVNSADANNPKVSVKVETSTEDTVAAGHIELVKGSEGLYGMMYYDGDDAE